MARFQGQNKVHGYDPKLPNILLSYVVISVNGHVDMLPCNEILSLRRDFVLKLI